MLLKVCNGAVLLFKRLSDMGKHLVTGLQFLLQISDEQLFFLELIQQVTYLLLLFALAPSSFPLISIQHFSFSGMPVKPSQAQSKLVQKKN